MGEFFKIFVEIIVIKYFCDEISQDSEPTGKYSQIANANDHVRAATPALRNSSLYHKDNSENNRRPIREYYQKFGKCV